MKFIKLSNSDGDILNYNLKSLHKSFVIRNSKKYKLKNVINFKYLKSFFEDVLSKKELFIMSYYDMCIYDNYYKILEIPPDFMKPYIDHNIPDKENIIIFNSKDNKVQILNIYTYCTSEFFLWNDFQNKWINILDDDNLIYILFDFFEDEIITHIILELYKQEISIYRLFYIYNELYYIKNHYYIMIDSKLKSISKTDAVKYITEKNNNDIENIIKKL